MNILTIDTATNCEIIAAAAAAGFSDRTQYVQGSHSVTLMDNIDVCLKEAGITINEVELIGVGVGPGSFTGIRLAVTTARMFAQLLDVPLVGIKTHLFYAASLPVEDNDSIIVAFDAKKRRTFGALYSKKKGHDLPLEIVPPGDYPAEYIVSSLPENSRVHMVGNGIEKYDSVFSGLPDSEYLKDYIPSGRISCRIVNDVYNKRPEEFNDLNNIVPFYARKSDAEVSLDSRKKKA